MAFTSDPTDPTSNAFCTVEFADEYLGSRLSGAEWTEIDVEERQRALVSATGDVSRAYIWKGEKSDETQTISFPRTGLDQTREDGTFPVPVQEATAEFAQSLITSATGNTGPTAGATAPLKSLKVDVLELEYAVDSGSLESATLDSAGLPLDVRRLLDPYIDSDSVESTSGFIQVEATA